jgi:tetratricopeptide (TPR) repeat protein
MKRNLLLMGYLLVAGAFAEHVFTAQQAASDPSVLPPARPQLLPVPLPDLNPLESSVAQQIREVQRSVTDLVTKTNLNSTDLAEAYGSLGQLYHAYEIIDGAEACYRNATRLRPDDFRWLHLLGYLHQQTGGLEEAVEFYDAALKARPDDHVATVHLGDVYLRLNRRTEARAQFQAALARFPAAALSRLGDLALIEGRYKDAIRDFEGALERVPQATRIHYSLAMAYRGLGQLDRAQAHLEQVGSADIRPVDPLVESLQDLLRGERAHLIQGRLAYQGGQYKDAAEAFAKAVEAAPGSAGARVNLASALAHLGDTEGAVRELRAALGFDPENVSAHLNLGLLLASQGRYADAVDHLRTVVEQTPDNAEASGVLTHSLLKLGRAEEAIGVLYQATSRDPSNEGTLLSLSIMLSERARYQEARDVLDRAHRLFPDRALTATTLARLLAASPDLSVRDGSRALDLAMAVYQAQPTAVHGETVALSLGELGRCGEAASWLQRALVEAERESDADLVARLKTELPTYERSPCRQPVTEK